MTLILEGEPPLASIAGYAPCADDSLTAKNHFWDSLSKTHRGLPPEALRAICMDANAKILFPPAHMEQHVGAFHMKGTQERVHNLSDNVRGNRQRFLNFVVDHDLCICNTLVRKTSRGNYHLQSSCNQRRGASLGIAILRTS